VNEVARSALLAVIANERDAETTDAIGTDALMPWNFKA